MTNSKCECGHDDIGSKYHIMIHGYLESTFSCKGLRCYWYIALSSNKQIFMSVNISWNARKGDMAKGYFNGVSGVYD